jgi:hypothetical protein
LVELYMAALDKAAMPNDEAFRKAVREHVEFGSRVAMQNSNAATDAELHPLRAVPKWTWPGDKSWLLKSLALEPALPRSGRRPDLNKHPRQLSQATTPAAR